MKISKEREEEFERRFNGYVMKIIERQYWKFITKKRREEDIISLNTLVSDGIELIDVLIGEDDIPMEFCDYKELEMLVEDKNVYKAIKSLTETEKLAIFLCIILNLNRQKVADIMKFKYKRNAISVTRRAIKKIRKQLKENGVDIDD